MAILQYIVITQEGDPTRQEDLPIKFDRTRKLTPQATEEQLRQQANSLARMLMETIGEVCLTMQSQEVTMKVAIRPMKKG